MKALVCFRKRPVLLLLALLSPVLLLLGCVTTGGSIQASYSQVSQLQEGDRFFEKGQYQTALLKYSSYYYSPFPNKQHEDYALYKIGLCQFLAGQYHDAQKSVNNLLKTYPNFEYMVQARDLLDRSERKIGERKAVLTEQWAVLQKDIVATQKLAFEKPNDPQYQFQLGDLYWRAGRYDDAVKQYEIAANMDRSYLEKKTLRERVRITQEGEFRLRDPLFENIQKSSPVRVIQMKRDRIRNEDWLGQYDSIRLSGFVENTGLYDVSNVRIEIAIYDFYDTVQETQIVPMGALNAGAKRPFSAMFNQYRGLAVDITKFTSEVFYDEPAAARR